MTRINWLVIGWWTGLATVNCLVWAGLIYGVVWVIR